MAGIRVRVPNSPYSMYSFQPLSLTVLRKSLESKVRAILTNHFGIAEFIGTFCSNNYTSLLSSF